jgi:uncharacterized protein (DUF58 family)
MIVPAQRLLLVSAIVVVPLATIAGLVPALLPACCAVLALCALAVIIDGFLARTRIDALTARAPAILRLTKDVPAHLPITIENRSRESAAMRLFAVMPAGVQSTTLVEEIAAPAGDSRFDWPCTGVVRGDHPLHALHLETTSPLGLWQARANRPIDCGLRVYPNLRDHATAALFLKSDHLGLRMRRQIGKGREFDNLRHYLPGDNFEDINWKATGRRHFPVVKLYRVEHAQEVYAVIDASRLAARADVLDSYVGAALHLALVAERQGDRFGLLTFSDRTHRFVRARGGMDHFRLCRETIYNLEPRRVSPDFREVFTTLQLNLRRRALLVFFTSLDDALLAETFEREIGPLARRHVVRVHVTQPPGAKPLFAGPPPPDLDSLYGSLAGQMVSNRLRELAIALGNRGVRLTVVDAANIKTRVAAEYLEVKRRQML